MQKRLQAAVLVGATGMGLVVFGGWCPATAAPPETPAATAAPSPLDVPLRLVAQARQSYQGVRDYTCLFIKKERLNGELQPDNLIAMKVRCRPFSVYLRWLGPKEIVGQEACYVSNQNNNKMRVHSTGLLGVAGFISIDPQDPRVMKKNRHPITDAGIGNLIQRYADRWQMERRVGKTEVRVADYEYNKRPCTRVETVHPEIRDDRFYSYRSVLYFDKQTHLPVRVENYDWPHPGGTPGGDLLESYSYVDLKLNVGLSNDVFDK